MKKNKYLSHFYRFMSRSFIVILMFTMIINILLPDQTISIFENRSLTVFPIFSPSKIMDGTFSKNISNWFSDQFVGRNLLIQSKYDIQKFLGQKYINGVYLTKKGLMNEINKPNVEQMNRNLEAINDFYRLFPIDTVVMMNPDSANINREWLPEHAEVINQSEQIEEIYSWLNGNIVCLNTERILKEHKNEDLYYKTDHHWTTLGAYYAFTELAKNRGFEINDIENYEIKAVSYDFEGTLASKSGATGIYDEVDIYVDPNTPEYILTDFTDNSIRSTLYKSEALSTTNPYEVFFGGNRSLLRLEMKNHSTRHLMVFKDSFANSMLPFLLPYYRTITVVDPRYYYYNDVIDMMQKYLITEVLYCYETNTFVQDTSLADLLEYNHNEYY